MSDRARTIATLGLLSGKAITIATDGLIQLAQGIETTVHELIISEYPATIDNPITVTVIPGAGCDGGPAYRIDAADWIVLDDEEVLAIIKLIIESGVLD